MNDRLCRGDTEEGGSLEMLYIFSSRSGISALAMLGKQRLVTLGQ